MFGARSEQRMVLLRSFDPELADDLDIPDPYLDRDFAGAFKTIERSCGPLLEWLVENG